MNRRKFIHKTAAIGSTALLGTLPNCEGHPQHTIKELSARSTDKSRIVIIQKKKWEKQKLGTAQFGEKAVSQMLSRGLQEWFQTESLEKIWKSIVRSDDIVGLKVNCLAGKGLSTSIELINAIISGLQLAGVKKKNILVWDRLNDDLIKAGYPINVRGSGVKYFGNDVAGYSRDLVCYGAVGSLVSRIVTDYCTAIINVPILKDHGIVGVSVAMKNYFGAIHNPNKYHDNLGDPFVADVNMFPDIRKKTRFTICDALVSQYEGGPPFMPQWAWNYGGLILGKDMVAIDQLGWEIIEAKRQLEGLRSLQEVGREPTYIATAASTAYQLGTNNVQQMDVSRVEI